MRSLAILLGAMALATAATARAEVGFQLEQAFASTSVQRGIPQYVDRGDPCMQTAGMLVLRAGSWGKVFAGLSSTAALMHVDEQPGNALELDTTAGTNFDVGGLAIVAGYAAALFPRHTAGTPVDGTHELFAVVSYPNSVLVPSLGAYAEVIRQRGAYVLAAVSRELRAGRWVVTPGASIGAAAYRNYLSGGREAGPHLNDFAATLAVRIDMRHGSYAFGRAGYALRGTPASVMGEPDGTGPGFGERSSVVVALGLGIAR